KVVHLRGAHALDQCRPGYRIVAHLREALPDLAAPAQAQALAFGQSAWVDKLLDRQHRKGEPVEQLHKLLVAVAARPNLPEMKVGLAAPELACMFCVVHRYYLRTAVAARRRG